jgi:hypothetical protein
MRQVERQMLLPKIALMVSEPLGQQIIIDNKWVRVGCRQLLANLRMATATLPVLLIISPNFENG